MGYFNTKNNLITLSHYHAPKKGSKYEAKQHTVIIDKNYDTNCAEISTDKENNKIHINPVEMIGENKSLTLKHGALHYEPLINRSTTSQDLN